MHPPPGHCKQQPARSIILPAEEKSRRKYQPLAVMVSGGGWKKKERTAVRLQIIFFPAAINIQI